MLFHGFAIALFKEFREQITLADQDFIQSMKNWGEAACLGMACFHESSTTSG
jgi:hypothetical protein